MREEKFGRSENIVLRSIAGESFLILLHAGESKMYSLNGMGLWFWKELEQPVTKEKLLADMLETYEVTEEAAAAEVDRFLGYLVDKNLACRLET